MLLRYTLAWIPMVLIAIANGALREFTYGKRVPELRAHQIATLIGMLLFGVYIFALTRVWRIESSRQAIMIGFIWVCLTVVFEFLFGHYVAGNSWEKLLGNYNIVKGRPWILILIWLLIAPYIFYLLSG